MLNVKRADSVGADSSGDSLWQLMPARGHQLSRMQTACLKKQSHSPPGKLRSATCHGPAVCWFPSRSGTQTEHTARYSRVLSVIGREVTGLTDYHSLNSRPPNVLREHIIETARPSTQSTQRRLGSRLDGSVTRFCFGNFVPAGSEPA